MDSPDRGVFLPLLAPDTSRGISRELALMQARRVQILEHIIRSLLLSPDKCVLAAASNGTVLFLDARSFEEVARITHQCEALRMCWATFSGKPALASYSIISHGLVAFDNKQGLLAIAAGGEFSIWSLQKKAIPLGGLRHTSNDSPIACIQINSIANIQRQGHTHMKELHAVTVAIASATGLEIWKAPTQTFVSPLMEYVLDSEDQDTSTHSQAGTEDHAYAEAQGLESDIVMDHIRDVHGLLTPSLEQQNFEGAKIIAKALNILLLSVVLAMVPHE
ncbi:hypothetical protein VTO73DRAFT_13132 [Trametes versicolor]